MSQAGVPRMHPSRQVGTEIRMCVSDFEDKPV